MPNAATGKVRSDTVSGSRLAGLSRFLLLLIASLALLVLGGCSEPVPEGLRFGLAQAPVTLDPRLATDAASSRINRLLYRALVRFDDEFRPVPELADWERLDALRYRFRLGDTGRRFHDGSHLVAADVAATLNSILAPETASPLRGDLGPIERIEVIDPDTLDIVLSRPDPLFPGRLAIGILPARLIAAGQDLARQAIGSGPFEFDSWDEQRGLRLRRVRDHMRLDFIVVPNPTVRVLKLLRGEVDLLQNDLPVELVRYLDEQPEVRVERVPGGNFSYLGFNLDDPLTGDPRVRQAVSAGIDRAAIRRYLFGGGARPATGILPPDHWAGAPSLVAPRYDPDRARTLLAEAGYGPGRPVKLTYKTSNDPFRIRVATIITYQLEQAGFQVDLRSYDWGTFYGDVKAGNFQVYSLAWVGINSPDIFRYVFHSDSIPPAGANRGRYRSQAADRLIDQALAVEDESQQLPLFRRLQALLLTDLPYAPLWYEDHVIIHSLRVNGYRTGLDGGYQGLADVVVESGEKSYGHD
jgi:peptide/nickel transport system substrate-binding protein